jgi:2,3-diphosphopglycerate-independent phosphoglycerate mutase
LLGRTKPIAKKSNVMADGGGGGGGAGLGKGAWDCDAGKAIPPEAEAAVFEEVRLDTYHKSAREEEEGTRTSKSAAARLPLPVPANSTPLKTPQKTLEKNPKIATMDMPFEGIPTVPPPKDRDHMAFFAGGCRYLVSAKPGDSVSAVKRRLFEGGIARAYPGEVEKAEDLELYYACVRMEEEGAKLEDYRVPAVRVFGGRRGGDGGKSLPPPRLILLLSLFRKNNNKTGLQDHDRAVDGAREARAAAQGERVLALRCLGLGWAPRSGARDRRRRPFIGHSVSVDGRHKTPPLFVTRVAPKPSLSSSPCLESEQSPMTAPPRGRVALVIVDGLGDVSVPSFDGRTPLQVAHTPHMDAIAGEWRQCGVLNGWLARAHTKKKTQRRTDAAADAPPTPLSPSPPPKRLPPSNPPQTPAAGANGLMDPVEPGLACGSDTSHMALLGYDPREHYRGRGAFEALGAGLCVGKGDVAFKCNFATCDASSNIVLKRRADRDFEREGPVLCEALDGLKLDEKRFPGCGVEVRYATEHRCGVVVCGGGGVGGLSDAITGTDPLRDGLPLLRCEPVMVAQEEEEEDQQGEDERRREERRQRQQQRQNKQQFTCDLVNHVSERMREVLEGHPINRERLAQGKNPANVVLLRGAGARLTGLPRFGAAALFGRGLRACMVAPTKIIAGVGVTFGLDVLPVPGATGDYRSDLAAKAAAVAGALDPLSSTAAAAPSPSSSSSSSYDFALLHVKAVDDAGHDRAVALKVRLLEAVDAMIGQLLGRLRAAEKAQEARWRERRRNGDGGDDNDEDDPRCVYAVCVTGDHSTPVVFGDHSHEPVPFAVARVRDAVAAARSRGDDEGDGGNDATAYPPIPMPDPHAPAPSAAALLRQLRQQEARHAAAAKGEAFPGGGGGGDGNGGDDDSNDNGPFGPWPEPWPSRNQARYDDALRFDEVTAGSVGGLGRFPGSEVMGLLAPFLFQGR